MRARFFVFVTLSMLMASQSVLSQGSELRGIWVSPRSGSGFWTKTEIARVMDSIANNNFNDVYFNAWSRGWPLWKSDVFFRETGYYADPLMGDRDILQEAIAEAHRRGLEIEAWMEYGFVAWWTGNPGGYGARGPLLARHPDWVGRTRSGNDSILIGPGSYFHWMSHNHPAVSQFMVQLHAEIARKYDVDGIELDRVRYPQLDFGYDSVSVVVYRQEHGGASPPANFSDAAWMRWRADKVNAFHRQAYDSIKAANRNATVSNAPSHYSSGTNYPAYESFLQDWRAWLNNGYLDGAQIQMYVSPDVLQNYIPSAISGVVDTARPKAYAGVAVKPNDIPFTVQQVLQLISVSRNAGLRGNSFWYYNDLAQLGFFAPIKAQAYQQRVGVPFRRAAWRDGIVILDERSATRTGAWTDFTLPPGSALYAWERTFSFTSDTAANCRYEFRVRIPATAVYELYAHQVGGLNNMTVNAPYEVFNAGGSSQTVYVDQSSPASAGWVKLADVLLNQGSSQLVVRLTNIGIGAGRYVAGDAVMLVLNRRLSPDAVVNAVGDEQGRGLPTELKLFPNYPNPFNPSTRIAYRVPSSGLVQIDIFDTLGKRVASLVNAVQPGGAYSISFDATGLASGIYLLRLQSGGLQTTGKMLLVK